MEYLRRRQARRGASGDVPTTEQLLSQAVAVCLPLSPIGKSRSSQAISRVVISLPEARTFFATEFDGHTLWGYATDPTQDGWQELPLAVAATTALGWRQVAITIQQAIDAAADPG